MSELHPDPCEHSSNAFLGSEFLTWIWWRAAQGQGEVELPELGPVAFWVDEELELRGMGSDDSKARWTGNVPVSGPEALGGLARGKRVTRLRLALRVQGREAEVAIVAENLDLVSVRNPTGLAKDAASRLEERLQFLELIRHLVDALFQGFLQSRLHPRWEEEWAPAMSEWIRIRQEVPPQEVPGD